MPTAMRVAAVRLARELVTALDGLADGLEDKARALAKVEKSARTHLHDAVPITLGEEFGAWAATVRRATARIRALEPSLLEVPLGGTAVGTSINAHDDYPRVVVERLKKATRLEVRAAENRIQSQQSLGDFVALSGALRALAVELSKIANDLRLLSSGPHTGFDEIELPATQPGSSIMPGKVNPAVAEMLNMVCYHVIGHDVSITMCAEAGQLEVNVMMPYVAHALLESLDVLAVAVRTFDEKCVRVVRAHAERCREYARRSVGRAALYNEELGFLGAAKLAEKAVETGKPVDEVAGQSKGD
jgi:aspartate ammonia-lyase